MKLYMIKKRIFASIFLIAILVFSVLNFMSSFEELKKTAAAIDWSDYENIPAAAENLNSAITESLYKRMNFIEVYAYVQTLLDKRESNNFSYIKDENGFLHYASFYKDDEYDLFEYALRMKRMQDYVSEQETKVLFVVPPGKYVKEATKFRTGMPVNDPNGIVDELLFYMNRLGIETLDLRNFLPNEKLPYDRTFFRTDHHWTIPASFYATKALVETIEERFDENLDPTGYYTDINNYTSVVYKNGMLGSMGRRTGASFTGLEDFEALWPDFGGSYYRESLRNEDYTISAEGDFSTAIMDIDVLTKSKSIYSDSQYSLYLNGLSPYDHIENLSLTDGTQIFMIRDSYFSPVMAFLIPMCKSIDAMWSLEDLDELDIESYIKENHFDYIIMEIYPYNISDQAFNFFKKGEGDVDESDDEFGQSSSK